MLKEKAIIEYFNEYHYKVFIETGTYLGEMVYALKDKFYKIYTIELSEYLFKTARNRFKENTNIHFLQGDSGIALEKIVKQISEPVIFWLDGHYSGGNTSKGEFDTPIIKELQSILLSPYSHIILIDDARCFGNSEFPDYPSIEVLKKFIFMSQPKCNFVVKDDIIRITL